MGLERRFFMNCESCDKMVLAILQGDDYPDTVSDLEEHGIYCTLLNSNGGFLMMALEEAK